MKLSLSSWSSTFRRCTKANYGDRARSADKSVSAQALAEQTGLELAVPPPKLCTDNGVMVAWAGIERMRLGLWEHLPAHAAPGDEAEWVDVRPRWPLTDRYVCFTSLTWSLPCHSDGGFSFTQDATFLAAHAQRHL